MEKVVCLFRSAIYWCVFDTQFEDCYCYNSWYIKNGHICRAKKAIEAPRPTLWPERIKYEQNYVTAKLPNFIMRTCMSYRVAITEMMSMIQTDLLYIHWSQDCKTAADWAMDHGHDELAEIS